MRITLGDEHDQLLDHGTVRRIDGRADQYQAFHQVGQGCSHGSRLSASRQTDQDINRNTVAIDVRSQIATVALKIMFHIAPGECVTSTSSGEPNHLRWAYRRERTAIWATTAIEVSGDPRRGQLSRAP